MEACRERKALETFKPMIALDGNVYPAPQDFSGESHMAYHALHETVLHMLVCGYASSNKFPLYNKDNKTRTTPQRAMHDSISLGLGSMSIVYPHDIHRCINFVCSCKIN